MRNYFRVDYHVSQVRNVLIGTEVVRILSENAEMSKFCLLLVLVKFSVSSFVKWG